MPFHRKIERFGRKIAKIAASEQATQLRRLFVFDERPVVGVMRGDWKQAPWAALEIAGVFSPLRGTKLVRSALKGSGIIRVGLLAGRSEGRLAREIAFLRGLSRRKSGGERLVERAMVSKRLLQKQIGRVYASEVASARALLRGTEYESLQFGSRIAARRAAKRRALLDLAAQTVRSVQSKGGQETAEELMKLASGMKGRGRSLTLRFGPRYDIRATEDVLAKLHKIGVPMGDWGDLPVPLYFPLEMVSGLRGKLRHPVLQMRGSIITDKAFSYSRDVRRLIRRGAQYFPDRPSLN